MSPAAAELAVSALTPSGRGPNRGERRALARSRDQAGRQAREIARREWRSRCRDRSADEHAGGTGSAPVVSEISTSPPGYAFLDGATQIGWEFSGHGDATLRCGRETKVGHRRLNGRWCLWDEVYRCPASSCPICYNQPGGYASRESESIDGELTQYFDWRNSVAHRGALRRRGDRERSHLRKPIHVPVAPPEERWAETYTTEGYRALRAEMYEQARMRGVDAGVAVFHHVRLRSSRWDANASLFEPDELDVPHLGPHWHIIGDGWVTPRGPLHERAHEIALEHKDQALSVLGRLRSLELESLPRSTRATQAHNLAYSLPSVFRGRTEACAQARTDARVEWAVSNKGVRVSIYQTAFYLLTHAGFARRVQNATQVGASYPRARSPVETVTWFGMGEFRRAGGRKETVLTHICARCGEEISHRDVIPVAYLPAGPPPKGDVEGDPSEWRAEGLNVATSRAEVSLRMARRLRTGTWKVREPRGLERWEISQANDESDRAWSDARDYAATHVDPTPRKRNRPRRGHWSDYLNGESLA